MRVKRLELLGFKSFFTKTLVQFEPGVTAIVGPNGSGKSNIVDGIRWVLGEHNPRDVRAPRLEDVIFNGTDHAAPLSMAQVSLTIDNERGLLPIPFTEVQVTRRVYRSGESECFINQSPCRLKDVQELFLGTGLGGGNYAIIEQGHIDLILSSKPQERRVVFEEASGIARYLTKKQETLRRLDGVEQDLLRAADITQEVKRQLSALERQATRARQYQTQWEQLKTWELRLAADELCEGEQAHQDVSARVSSLGEQRRRLEEERRRLLGSLEQCNATVAATQATLQQVRTHLVQAAGHVEQQTSQHTLKMTWIGEVTAQREGVLQEVVRLEERASGLNQQLVRLQEQAQMLANDTQAAQRRRAATSEALSQLEQSLAEGLARVEQGKAELFGAAALASQQRNALAGATLRAQQVDIQLNRAQEQHRALEERIETLAKRRQQLEEERATLDEGHHGLQRQLTAARESAAQAQHHRQPQPLAVDAPAEGDNQQHQNQDLNQKMDHVAQNDRNRDHLPVEADFLHQRRVVQDRVGARGPPEGEEIERNQPDQHEQGEIRDSAGKNPGEDVGEHDHHDQWIQQGPEDPERHITVTDLEVLADEVVENIEVIVCSGGHSGKDLFYRKRWEARSMRMRAPEKGTPSASRRSRCSRPEGPGNRILPPAPTTRCQGTRAARGAPRKAHTTCRAVPGKPAARATCP